MSSKARWVWLVVVVVSAAAVPGARALSTDEGEGTLAGLIVDETEAVVPDVVVSAMNTATGMRRQTTSIGDGSFAMPALPAGAYVVTAEHDGFAPLEIRNVQIGRDQYLALRIRLRLGHLQNSIEVTPDGVAPMDVAPILLTAAARATSGIRVSGAMQQQLPLASTPPNYSDALYLASGVITRDQLGRQIVHGAEGSDTLVLVDGADITSNRTPTLSTLHLGPEAIEHVEVRTAGLDASTPLTQGAVLKVTTRTGGNEIRGEAAALFRGRNWVGNNEPGGTSASGNALQPEVAAGGPLRKDRAWAFGTYSRRESRYAASRTAADIAVLTALVPGWKPYDLSARSQDGYAKITGRPSPVHEIDGFYQANTSSSDGPGGPAAAPFLRNSYGGRAFGGSWNAVWSNSLISRLSASFNDKTYGPSSDYQDVTAVTVHRGVYQSGAVIVGTGAIAYLNAMSPCCTAQPASKLSIGGDFTWYRAKGRGTHELQFGFLLQPRLRLAVTERFNNSGFDLEEVVLLDPNNAAAGFKPFHRVMYDGPESTFVDSHGTDDAVFVQDGWRPANRLTIAAGVRVDHITDSDVSYGRQARNVWAIGPRASATWQVTPSSTLRGSWGRVHESSPSGRYSSETGGTVARHDLFDTNLDGTFETRLDVFPTTMVRGTGVVVDVERRQAYVNEVTAGYRAKLRGRIALDAALVRRDFHALPLVDPGYVYKDGFVSGLRPGVTPGYGIITADVWSVPVVTDFTIQATRLTSTLQVIASYTRTFRHMSGTWVPSDPASVLQPQAFDNDKGIGSTSVGTANSFSANAASEFSVDHSFRATFAAQLPWRLFVAGNYQLQSGPWSGPIITTRPEPPRGPLVLHFDNGSLPNPLAMSARFAYSTRGEGQLQLPLFQGLNLRIGKRLQTGWGRVDVALDVFNPFNWGRFLTFKSLANYTSSTAFGQGAIRQQPRTFQASFRVFF